MLYIYIYIYIYIYVYILLSCFIGGSLVPAMCNRKLYAQLHELPQSHCVVDHLCPLILRCFLDLLSAISSLVSELCNCASFSQLHRLPQSHCDNNRGRGVARNIYIYRERERERERERKRERIITYMHTCIYTYIILTKLLSRKSIMTDSLPL